MRFHPLLLSLLAILFTWNQSQSGVPIVPSDLFDIEFASDPQISPNGEQVVYVRNSMDRLTDRRRSNLWVISTNGKEHRRINNGGGNQFSPCWSPDGSRFSYLSSSPDRKSGPSQIYVRWNDSGDSARISDLPEAPKNMSWSPDGKWIAFVMKVPSPAEPLVKHLEKPKGSEWAAPPKVIDHLIYRTDKEGYVDQGYDHLFVLPSEGGTARQITSGPYSVQDTPVWMPDGNSIVFTSKRYHDWEHHYKNSELYKVTISDGTILTLTDRDGPDESPTISPDGSQIAYIGYDDKYQIYQSSLLYVMDADGKNRRALTDLNDPSVKSPLWSGDGQFIYFQHDTKGKTSVSKIAIKDGTIQQVVERLGGTYLARPYPSGSYSVSRNGLIAYTLDRPDRPADVALGSTTLTDLNSDVFDHKQIAGVEEHWTNSSYDGNPLQYWIMKPPGYDPAKKYPTILEIHGGPFTNYGPRFSFDFQWYAASGYVILYANPRGSSSYGEEFGNAIHHSYPGHDYDDLMSVVDDAMAKESIIDEQNLFVTGESGGGILTSWIVGKTNRFRAAVASKPVINWSSFVLTSDLNNYFYKYWFPGPPWECPQHYHSRSPLSFVGNVTTPTMLLTGEFDYRTPISESEQFYQSLKIRKVDTALIRVPGASHSMTTRPSQMLGETAHTLAWFERYRVITNPSPIVTLQSNI